jgi:tetratricopeptide (TPR) repeat protein
MLPPIEMLAKKNRLPPWILSGLLLALLLAGCTPAGPRALLNGKRRLDAGDYTGAVAEFRTATALLPANAAAWNYLGVAYQKAQQPDNAATAYQRALVLNRDLVEAHWNLGMLWLEQGKNDQALSEFTAYTLRRNNLPEGWLKMGAVQLRMGEYAAAERSFGAALTLDPGNAEAINGQGLARLERNRPRDAVQFFASALRSNPNAAAPMLNLAITEQQYLHDDRTALEYYQAYLALTPRPDNWEEVNAEATSLEQSLQTGSIPAQMPPQEETRPPMAPETVTPVPAPPAVPVMAEARRVAPVAMHPSPTIRTQAVVRPMVSHPQVTPPQLVVHNQPIVQTQRVAVIAPAPAYNPNHPQAEPPPAPRETTTAEAAPKPGFWDRIKPAKWFAPTPDDPKYENTGTTPLTTVGDGQSANTTLSAAGSEPDPEREAKGPPTFPRYGYLAPARPAPGDRRAASGSFTRARVFEQGAQWMDAMQEYRSAAQFDPSWFEAQYNFGVLSYRLGNHRQALEAYEMALAIEPDSIDARYNFALALKAGGYVPDAVNELKKILAREPDEVRAHLALGNLYAQKLRAPNEAREHYLKVLELDPGNPSAAEIRNWLSLNSN